MQNRRELFFKHLAQTSDSPPAIEIAGGEGCFVTDHSGKKYFDFISGISVSNLGHGHPFIKKSIHDQVEKHLHLMVYGEYILAPQVILALKLAQHLPAELQSVYLTNSGSEATEGAMKLAKRFTGRTEFISFRNSYHGSTQGALSICGNESLKSGYRPLLPGHRILDFNSTSQLEMINSETAAVFAEPIQAEAGIVLAENGFLQALRNRCSEQGALLVFDEIQTAMGRTGSLFAFKNYDVVPDILLLGKAFGGGMPLGAFISSDQIMSSLKKDPALGHMTTTGGHPVSCAAAIASLELLTEGSILQDIHEKEKILLKCLNHKSIKEVRGKGLFYAIEFDNEMMNQKVIQRCFETGLLSDWFLFNAKCMRLAPPLLISIEEIQIACEIIVAAMD